MLKQERMYRCLAFGAYGDAWIWPNALGLALYHVLSDGGTYACIYRAANINGDSDTVASIAGNLFGAFANHNIEAPSTSFFSYMKMLQRSFSE